MIERTANLESHAVQDVLQETLLSAYRWLHRQSARGKTVESPLAVTMKIAARRANDYLRKHYQRKERLKPQPGGDTSPAAYEEDLDRFLELEDEWHAVHRALPQLPETQRVAVEQRLALTTHTADDVSIEQLATAMTAALGRPISASAAKKSWQRGRDRLREVLG